MYKSKLFKSLSLWRKWKTFSINRCLANDSVQLAFKVHNETGIDDPTKLPIIILHGALGCKTNWNSLSKAISMTTRRKVIAVDSRGHGESPHHPIVNYDVMSDDILNFMRAHGYPKATLIGHSMGGRSAMAAALKNPGVIERLVIVDVSPVDNRDPHVLPKAVEALLQLKINSTFPLAKMRKEADFELSSTITEEPLRQFLLTNLVTDPTTGGAKWQCDLRAMADNFKYIRSFPLQSFSGKTFDKPTIFISGSASDYVRKEDLPTIRKYFTKAQFHTVVGAGHWLHSEKPKEFLEVVATFIAY